jgi:hypothetical protein
MFVAHHITLDVGFRPAQARLANLVCGRGLNGASQAAYEAGLASVIRVGPFGEVPGASKLVQVRFLDPVCHAEALTVGLRWEATGLTGGLFPVLDADISLVPEGEQKTRLALAGAYRPPAWQFRGWAGQGDPQPRRRGDHPHAAAKRSECSCPPRGGRNW